MNYTTAENKSSIDFLLSILFLQYMLYVTIIFNILIARQVIGILYLTFIPGLAFIKLLKLKKLDIAETILFSVGLSIAFSIVLGLFINEIYPLFGIKQPLLLTPMLITQSTIVLIAIVYSLKNQETTQLSFHKNVLPIFVIPVILFILGIYSTFALNTTMDNSIALTIIIAITILFLSTVHSQKINQNFYPLILLAITTSILFFVFNDTSLITKYIIGKGDQWIEYQAFKLTLTNYYWNSTLPPTQYTHVLFPTYSMLSVTSLPTIFTQITQLDESWTFKIIYPFIVSFMALGTYKLYTTQTDEKTAFLAAFFFITIATGKGWGSAKQMIAQLFYVLLIILLINKKISPTKRKILFIIFSFALVTSHYALSYIFTFMIISFLILSFLLNYFKGSTPITNEFKTLTNLTMIYLIIVFSWGVYINASESFNLLLDSINTITRHINEFFEPQSRGTALLGLGVVPTPTVFHQISTALFLLTESFIVIGFLKMLTKRKKTGFNRQYIILSTLNLAIIAANLLLPRLADTFLMSRFYQTTLIVLAPVGILGGQTIIEQILKILKIKNLKKLSASILVIFILTPLFLFQTGFIYEIAKVRNESMPLSMYRWGRLELHRSIIETEEVLGATWLSKHIVSSEIFVYSDLVSKYQVLTAYGIIERGRILLLSNSTKTVLNNNEFVYLGYIGVIDGKIETQLVNVGYCILNTTDLFTMLANQNQIYNNGECSILKGHMFKP
jgi:uncharacterized membrane protein